MKKTVDVHELLERLQISYTTQGDKLWARCPHPEHPDQTPSWRIFWQEDHDRFGQHRCYGCGFGGYPIQLVEGVFGCSRDEAREWLQDIHQNPPLPHEVRIEIKPGLRGSKFRLPEGVVTGQPLKQWDARPRAYAESRSLPDWQIARWGIGYALEGRLRGRIVLPVRDAKSRLVGYTARAFLKMLTRKYLEPSKDEGATLGVVFGEQHWPDDRHTLVVTEGGFNGLACERVLPDLPFGALYGSQILPGHIARISTFKRVLIATDPDDAGNSAAQILFDQLRKWVDVGRVELPPGEDCDSMNRDELKETLEKALGEEDHSNWNDQEVRSRSIRARDERSRQELRRQHETHCVSSEGGS